MKNNFYKKVSILKQYAKENGINNQTLEIMSKASGLSIEKIQELLAIPTGSVLAPKSFVDKLSKKDLEVLESKNSLNDNQAEDIAPTTTPEANYSNLNLLNDSFDNTPINGLNPNNKFFTPINNNQSLNTSNLTSG